ncbi:type II toxin-antitoxin system PemK/MazF family toxin [Corynebacterium caspium]|uniref:type II toxin-antitoxin system PemK/MazF family toxin n=1 Tax=Corynebacterium caspium TaxID=234828 RepID=UPI00035F79CD|nr:type II toxin-antitoxin system PemK/MazF family toxin [Corynebacterium caspium]WKD58864.1 hypothetical protein CCASP_02280 [Corynebacterium caspium DSM 44850]
MADRSQLSRRQKRSWAALRTLNERLGFREICESPAATDSPAITAARIKHDSPRLRAEALHVLATGSIARPVIYGPAMDGQPEPGEVIWFWAPTEDPSTFQERAALVVGHNREYLLCLLISPDPTHATDDAWLGVGSGDWDEQGRASWVRLDRVIEVPLSDIRRSGAILPRGRFERIATNLRNRFGWT